MPVREFVETDIPQVTNLYWNHMVRRKGAMPSQILSTFAELYFASPFFDSRSPSFVYQDSSGDLVGFLGVSTRNMSLSGQPIRVSFGGNFVIHPKARSGLAAPRLLAAFMGGTHDLYMTDSANEISRHLLERLGFHNIAALNLHWVRPLRPTHFAAYTIFHGMSPTSSAAFRFATKPLCRVIDSLAGKSLSHARQRKSRLHGGELSVEALLQCLAEFRSGYSLWPEYNAELLTWLLSFMERNRKHGNLRRVLLRDETQKIVGWYIYYAKPGAVGEVVQIGGAPESFKDVIAHLLQDAREQGVIGLHGLAHSKTMADFSDENCFFTCRGGWSLAHSRRPELIDILQRGSSFLSRMDGEWCLHPMTGL